jgi:NAD(P)-dependent dehydrogenase (short-subunit alcohol dehydrogenase family)
MADYSYKPEPIEGKRILITGGTTGIGRSTAQVLASKGASVLIFGRHQPELDDAMRDIRETAKADVLGLIADQAQDEDIQKVFQDVDSKLGGIDVLINNAAVSGESILDKKAKEWKYVLDANLFGYMACCKYAIERMQASGSGHIVNVGSMSASETEPEGNVYVAPRPGSAASPRLCESL